jgi:hypothetical protein
MLTKENIDAVEYFVKEDPLILVGNLEWSHHYYLHKLRQQ